MKKIFTILCLFVVFPTCVMAQAPANQKKAILVKRVIELNHYSPRVVDDSFSLSLFRRMINITDPRRLLFTEPEYKSLSSYSLKLDDELKGNGWGFLDQFIQVYKKAVARADSMINSITKKPFDFTVSETITAQRGESYFFAANNNELYSRWNRYLKLLALERIYEMADDSVSSPLAKGEIAKHEPAVRAKIKLSELKALNRTMSLQHGIDNYLATLYLDAIATRFDPHTNYFSQEVKEDFKSSLSTETLSFGLEFDEDDKGNIIIDHLVPGGPAWKSGELHKGDELQQLYWENKDPADIGDLTIEEVYNMLEQPTNEKLVVKVKKANGTIKTVILKKEKMSNEENIVKSFVLKGEKKIGYILLPGFYTEWENETGSGCANDVAKEIIKLKRENIDGLVIDVRFNGGGSLQEGLEMTGIFVDEGPLAAQKNANGKVSYYKDPNRGVIYDGPLALMVNGQSASASEMLAASLQDYHRAVIIGSPTYGKASMQRLFPLDTNYRAEHAFNEEADVVKITFGKFYRLDGGSAQIKGVKPDVVLPDAFDGLNIGERFSKHALTSDTIQKNTYYRPLSNLPVAELASLSVARTGKDPDFQNIQNLVDAQSEARSKSQTIPLKWDLFEKWVMQKEKDLKIIEGESIKPGNKFEVVNNQHDMQWLKNNEYESEINQKWLENIAEDIYIRESFLVVCDLINLRRSSSKN